MKKILLSASVLGVVLVSAQSGIYVASGGNVHVQPQTLVYSQGGLEVTETGTVVSDGHVQLETKYSNAKADGSNVQFLYTDAAASENSAYGQLIIKDGATTSGKVYMENPIIKGQTGAWVEIGFPFVAGGSVVGVVNSALKTADLTSYGNNIADAGTYFNRPVYYQKNLTHEVEPVGASLMSAGTMYTLQVATKTGFSSSFVADASSKSIVYAGVPYTGAFDISQAAQVLGSDGTTTFESVSDLGTNKLRKNSRKHYYLSYVEDFVVAASDGTWGHNLYGYANPYTSNISLTQLFTDSSITTTDVSGIAVHGSETATDLESGAGSSYGKYYVQTCANNGGAINTTNCTGDLSTGSDIILRPFGTFWAKFRTGKSVKTLKFSDNIKTFGYTGLFIPGSTLVGNGSGQNGSVSSGRIASSRQSSARSSNNANTTNALEVLNLTIAHNDDNINNVFIAANPWSTNEFDDQLDAVDAVSTLRVINEDTTSVNKNLHINGISMSEYVGKPINLAVDTKAGKQYSFKGSVRIAANENLDNSNFFLEDKQAKKIVRVGSDFNYSYFASDNDDNRFTVYYKETPVDVDEVIDEVTESSMGVAKDASGENYVVFKGMTGKAKVMVYNVLGQLVYADEEVSTNVNYSLSKLPKNSGVYIVKVIDEKGKVISKKIVK